MKKLSLVGIILFLISTRTLAQCTSVANGGGSKYDDGFLFGAVSDAAGNIYFCGSFVDTAHFGAVVLPSDLTAQGGYFFNKYDSQGNLLWSQSLGNIIAAYGFKPIAISGNNIYITCGAYYFQEGVDTVNSNQVILWKLDTSGTLLWRKNFLSNGFGSTYSSSVIPDGAGGVFVTGRFRDSLMLNQVTLYSTTFKAWMAHIDPNGNTIWAKQAASTDQPFTNRGNDIVQLSNGNIAMCGYYKDSLQFDNHILNESSTNAIDGPVKYKPYVALFDSSGNNLWVTGFTTEGEIIHTFFDCPYGIGKDSLDNIYITGTLSDSTMIQGTLVYAGEGHTFYAKFSPAGTVQWIKEIPGGNSNMCWGTGIFSDSQNLLLVGNFNGVCSFGNTTDTSEYTDVFVAKADFNGNILSHIRSRGDIWEISYQGFYSNNELLVAGDFSSHLAIFPFANTLQNYDTSPDTTADAFFWKICVSDLVSVTETNPNHHLFSLFPNPSSHHTTIDLGKIMRNVTLTVHDIQGNLIYKTFKPEAQKMELSTRTFADGIYVLQIQTSEFFESKKLIVVN